MDGKFLFCLVKAEKFVKAKKQNICNIFAGLKSAVFRHFLKNICQFRGSRYLEITCGNNGRCCARLKLITFL